MTTPFYSSKFSLRRRGSKREQQHAKQPSQSKRSSVNASKETLPISNAEIGQQQESARTDSPLSRFSLPKSQFPPNGLRPASKSLPPSQLALRPSIPSSPPVTTPSTSAHTPSTRTSTSDAIAEDHILIGIDFGTTYSGVAWAYSKQPEDIKIITNWDSQEWMNSDKGKAPTELAYGEGGNTTWGYGIGDTESVKWFKLLLLDEGDIEQERRSSPQVKRARELLQRAGKTPVQAVGDYLRLLWNHSITNIKKDFGEVSVDGLPFRVVLTVPAVWTTKAVGRMRQAAIDAGILDYRLAGDTTLHFVAEPEAAALATLDDLKTRPNFKSGDSFVVCDAGGGTVDLISYKVQQSEPMQLRECVEGSGKLCGAVFLDQDFEALMDQLIGDPWGISESAIKEMTHSQWENGIKRLFEGQDRNWKIQLPFECIQKGAPQALNLDQGYVTEIFNNVTSQVRALVNDQINAVKRKENRLPKAVVLVGGFGNCRYLFKTLSMENKARGIEVYQSSGAKPWTAICRGAVLKALTNSKLPGVTVNSRISRHSYGYRCSTEYMEGIHLPSDKFYENILGFYLAKDQMEWFLNRGDNIADKKPIRLDFSRFVPLSNCSSPHMLVNVIHSCEERVPPDRYSTSAVQKSCTIKSSIETTDINVHVGKDGKQYKRLNFEVEMTVIGTALEFSLIFAGQRLGRSNVEVDLQEGVRGDEEFGSGIVREGGR